MDADKTNEDDLNENKVIEPETTESTPFLRKELSSEIPYMDNISFGSNSVNSVHMYTEKINVESSKKDELSNGLTLGNQLNQTDKASLNNASFEGVVFGNEFGAANESIELTFTGIGAAAQSLDNALLCGGKLSSINVLN